MRTFLGAVFLSAVALSGGCTNLDTFKMSFMQSGTRCEKVCSQPLDKTMFHLKAVLKDRGLEVVKTEDGAKAAKVWAKKGPLEFVFELVEDKGTRIKLSASVGNQDAFGEAILAAVIAAAI